MVAIFSRIDGPQLIHVGDARSPGHLFRVLDVLGERVSGPRAEDAADLVPICRGRVVVGPLPVSHGAKPPAGLDALELLPPAAAAEPVVEVEMVAPSAARLAMAGRAHHYRYVDRRARAGMALFRATRSHGRCFRRV